VADQDFLLIPALKGFVWFDIWENPSIPKTAAPLLRLISLCESVVHCHISGIAALLLGRYGA
tara:strand:+ start:1047 stop:1232 length:186 start_codon:yes stop_codon:yes gene_type:complete